MPCQGDLICFVPIVTGLLVILKSIQDNRTGSLIIVLLLASAAFSWLGQPGHLVVSLSNDSRGEEGFLLCGLRTITWAAWLIEFPL